MSAKLQILGQKFNRLTAISEASGPGKWTYWLFKCDCGNELILPGFVAKNGYTKSCGCLQRQRASEACYKHGMHKTPEYYAWVNMKTRCYREVGEDYPDYGGRGIIVCDRWMGKDGFNNFLEDMGEKPSRLHSLDRIDTDGHYGPDNCRWAIEEQQVRNKRNNVWYEHKGLKMILSDWARYFGVDQGNLKASIKVRGISGAYDFYLEKHGTLPAKKEYISPGKRAKGKKQVGIEKLKSLYTK